MQTKLLARSIKSQTVTMEGFQRQLRLATEDPAAEDPLWTLTPASEDPPDEDMAQHHLGEEPANLQVYIQTAGFLDEYYPAQESSSSSDDQQSVDSDDYIATDSSDTIYMSDVDMSESDPELSSEDGQEDGQEDERESAEIRAERRHGRRLFAAIESWMEAQYIQRLEEEANHIKNNPRNITWTDDRLFIFKLICKNDIRDTLQQLREGSILCPLSQTKLEE